MKTKANIHRTAENINEGLRILAGLDVGPSGASWQDVAGSLACNLRVLANALDEQRSGRMDFAGGMRPTDASCLIIGRSMCV